MSRADFPAAMSTERLRLSKLTDAQFAAEMALIPVPRDPRANDANPLPSNTAPRNGREL